MTVKKAEAILILSIILRSLSYPLTKAGLGQVGTFTMLSVRFLLSFGLLVFLFRHRVARADRRALFHGTVIGLVFFLCMALELTALKTTSSSVTAFLENTAIVLVPLFTAIGTRTFPKPAVIVSALLALAGVGLITLQGSAFHLSAGEVACLGAAITYAFTILLNSFFSRQDDPVVLGIVQIGAIGTLALPCAFLFEPSPFVLPVSFPFWLSMAVLILVCTVAGFVLQPVSMKYVDVDRAGMFCAVNPVAAMILGMLFLGEEPGLSGFLGAALIAAAIVVMNRLEAWTDRLSRSLRFLRPEGTGKVRSLNH